MKNKVKPVLCLLLIAAMAAFFSCKKKTDAHVPPSVSFKTGGNYTSGDKTINKNDSVLVGISATKTEDDLRSYNISAAYDGATGTTTKYQYYLGTSEYNSFSKDYWVKARNQTGSERWVFSIQDKDGNITQKSLTLTVQ
jgi:hypothetical protein